MEPFYKDKYHEIEKDFWIFNSRRDFIKRLLKKYPKTSNILDIGCSGGVLIEELNKMGFRKTYGIDISEKSVKVAKNKGIKNVSLMDAAETSFSENEFDIIVSSDVLEHIEDDISALKEWRRILKPNGRLFCFVPAFQWLWSHHDEINGHYRRYKRGELEQKIKRSGFKIKRNSYWNIMILFPAYIYIKGQKVLGIQSKKDNLIGRSLIINNIAKTYLRIENFVLKRVDSPIGVTSFVIATA